MQNQTEPNTFQSVLATNGTKSYAVFTYECGKLNWMHYSATIGFSASDDFFAEHPLSRNSSVNDIACINEDSMPPSNWSNVAYEITNGEFENCNGKNYCSRLLVHTKGIYKR